MTHCPHSEESSGLPCSSVLGAEAERNAGLNASHYDFDVLSPHFPFSINIYLSLNCFSPYNNRVHKESLVAGISLHIQNVSVSLKLVQVQCANTENI